MSTTKQAIKDVFYIKVENDEAFFDYFNLPEQEAVELVEKRADNLLTEAIAYFKLKSKNSDLDFSLDEDGNFKLDFTDTEIDLLASIMNFLLFKKDFNRLKNLDMNFTPKDLQVFSPSANRKTFIEMYTNLKHEISTAIKDYCDRTRDTNKLIAIDYTSYADSL